MQLSARAASLREAGFRRDPRVDAVGPYHHGLHFRSPKQYQTEPFVFHLFICCGCELLHSLRNILHFSYLPCPCWRCRSLLNCGLHTNIIKTDIINIYFKFCYCDCNYAFKRIPLFTYQQCLSVSISQYPAVLLLENFILIFLNCLVKLIHVIYKAHFFSSVAYLFLLYFPAYWFMRTIYVMINGHL